MRDVRSSAARPEPVAGVQGEERSAEPASAISYSTGGGGTVLEHRYGAFVLAHLLSGAPLTELHDQATLVDVHFQARNVSAVDDLVVRGALSNGTEVGVAVAVRRDPLVRASNRDTQALIASLLRALDDNYNAVSAGTWRVALASANTSRHALELVELTGLARAAIGDAAFRASVPNRALQNRLRQVDGLVSEALAKATWTHLSPDAAGVTWALLRVLRVRPLRLEGGDQSDQTISIGLLTPLTAERTAEQAGEVFQRLMALVGDYAPTGARVDEGTLRAAVGAPLAEDLWIGGDGRRVARQPAILRYLTELPARLRSERYSARRVLGLRDDQIQRSLTVEPPLPTELLHMHPGEALVIQGPLGSGKTDIALRWLLEDRPDGAAAWGAPVPVFLRVEDMRQPTLAAAIEAATGFPDAAARFGADVVIDGLDERPGSSVIGLALAFVKQFPKSRIVLTAREGELVPHGFPTTAAPELEVDDVRRLVGAILGIEPWRVGYNWTPDFFHAARRPLFALLAAVYGDTAGDTRASLVGRAVQAALAGRPVAADLELLALETVRAGAAIDPRAVPGLSLSALTGAAVTAPDGPRVRFVLPVFEQWFAAQAVLSGKVQPAEFTNTDTGFARWRYVLAVALATGTQETIRPWMDHLVRTNPAAASWVIREGVRTDLSRTVAPLGGDAALLGQQIWDAMDAWMEGLGTVSPVLGPGLVLGIDSPGSLAGVRLAVDRSPGGRVTLGWFRRLSEDIPPVSTGLPDPGSPGYVPHRLSSGPGPNSEAWAWANTLGQMNHQALTTILRDGDFLASSTPPNGVVRTERQVWFAVHALGFNDVWPVRISAEAALRKIDDLLAQLTTRGETTVVVKQLRVKRSWLRETRRSIEGGGAPLDDIWPGPDLAANLAGANAYSPKRAVERVNAVYEGAALAYQELHQALFLKWGRVLGHAATFPAILEGTFSSGAVGPWGGDDLGSAFIDYWFRPVRDTSNSLPLAGNLRWGTPERSTGSDEDEAFSAFMRRRHEDPVGSAFELTSIHSSVVDSSLWGRRPATHIAVNWLLEDLKALGWGKGGRPWEQLK